MPNRFRTLLVTPKFRVDEIASADSEGKTRRRAVVRHPGAVAVIPVLDDGRVCLIRNRRPSVDQTLIEIPAGTRDSGEDPEQTAPARIARGNRVPSGPTEAAVQVFHLTRSA